MDTEDELDDQAPGIDWAWDVVRALEHGRANAVLVTQRAAADDPEHEEGTTLFVASTDDEDRAMDIVRQDWDQQGRMRAFNANPVICDNHIYTRVVGRGPGAKVPRVGDDAGRLMIRSRWDLENPDPSIRAVGHQHINDFRNAGSVGFNYGKRTERHKLDPNDPYFRQAVEIETWWGGTYEMSGFLYEKNSLLEFSSATIPMNPNALQRSYLAEMGLIDPEDIERRTKLVGETVPKRTAGDLLSFLKEPANRRAAMDLLWPDLLDRVRTDKALRRVLLALVDAAPVVPLKAEPDLFEQVALLLE